jgi:hypothetical protein
MRDDLPHVNHTPPVFHRSNQAVLIASDVEHGVWTSDISMAKVPTDISRDESPEQAVRRAPFTRSEGAIAAVWLRPAPTPGPVRFIHLTKISAP